MADEIKLVELEDGWVTYVLDAEATRAVQHQELRRVFALLGLSVAGGGAGWMLGAAFAIDPAVLVGLVGSMVGAIAAVPFTSMNAPAGWRLAASHRGLGLRRVYGKNAGTVPVLREDRPSRASRLSPWEGERVLPWMDLEQVRATDVSLILTVQGGEQIELPCEEVPRADIARLADKIQAIKQRYQGKGASAEEAEAALRDLQRLKQQQGQHEG